MRWSEHRNRVGGEPRASRAGAHYQLRAAGGEVVGAWPRSDAKDLWDAFEFARRFLAGPGGGRAARLAVLCRAARVLAGADGAGRALDPEGLVARSLGLEPEELASRRRLVARRLAAFAESGGDFGVLAGRVPSEASAAGDAEQPGAGSGADMSVVSVVWGAEPPRASDSDSFGALAAGSTAIESTAIGSPATGPAATGPAAIGSIATGPTETGPTETGPTETGPTETGPTAADAIASNSNARLSSASTRDSSGARASASNATTAAADATDGIDREALERTEVADPAWIEALLIGGARTAGRASDERGSRDRDPGEPDRRDGRDEQDGCDERDGRGARVELGARSDREQRSPTALFQPAWADLWTRTLVDLFALIAAGRPVVWLVDPALPALADAVADALDVAGLEPGALSVLHSDRDELVRAALVFEGGLELFASGGPERRAELETWVAGARAPAADAIGSRAPAGAGSSGGATSPTALSPAQRRLGAPFGAGVRPLAPPRLHFRELRAVERTVDASSEPAAAARALARGAFGRLETLGGRLPGRIFLARIAPAGFSAVSEALLELLEGPWGAAELDRPVGPRDESDGLRALQDARELGLAEGATLIHEPEPPGSKRRPESPRIGTLAMGPTVFTNVEAAMRIAAWNRPLPLLLLMREVGSGGRRGGEEPPAG